MDHGIIRLAELKKLVHFGKSTIFRLEKRGQFPKRVKLTQDGVSVGWRTEEIDAWLKHMHETYQDIVRHGEIQAITALSLSTITRLEKIGKFPQRLRLPPLKGKFVGWRASEVKEWLKQLPTTK